jgi:ATP-dependent RNA helicase UAP56/SUB2
MSSNDNEELIDYEDEHDVIPNGTASTATANGAATSAADGDVDKDKKNFSGIHSTGFRFIFHPYYYEPWPSNDLSFFSQGLLVET